MPDAGAVGALAGFWRRFRRNRTAVLGAAIITTLVLVAIFAPYLEPYDYTKQVVAERLQGPSARHWLGTDPFGRDVLSRIIRGSRVSLTVGLISVGIALAVGVPVGAIAGYFRGRVDLALMWWMDLLLSFPGLLLAIAIASALGPSLFNTMIAIGIVNIPAFARLVRGPVLAVAQKEYVEAAAASGAGHPRIIAWHLLPNVLPVILVRATLGIGTAILTEAGLSFLGLGAQPPTPSWGGMLADGRAYLRTAAYLTTLPGLAIMVTVLSFNWLGDGLRDALDPRLKQ